MIYKEIRLQLNLYQWEVAEILGVSENAYKKYELGYNTMPDELKIKMLSLEENNKYEEVVKVLKKIDANMKKCKST